MYTTRAKIPDTRQWHDTLVRARVALGYFVLVAALGLLLRWQLVSSIDGLKYKNFLHAHSHVALLGWLYCAFFAALLYAFPQNSGSARRSFNRQFMLTQVAVLGMLFTFPVQGYGVFSIFFSTLHILLSYWFAWSFRKYVKQDKKLKEKHQTSLRFIGMSLLFLVLSSIGPWAMGPIMATGGIGNELYYNAIYFYLHFQYNGWFTFAVLGLFFWLLESKGINYNVQLAKRVFQWLTIACVLTFALSVLWTRPAAFWYGVGGAGAILQVVALVYFFRILWEIKTEIVARFMPWVVGLFALALFSLTIKVFLQVASAFPSVADLAYQVRYFIIGYLHLSLIGFVSLFMLAFFLQQQLYRLNSYGKLGVGLLLLFFFLTETLMFLQGTLLWLRLPALPDFNLLMFLFSIGMPVGLGLVFFTQPGLSYLKKGERIELY